MTIKDVAKRAGVAISTASAAINRSAPVSVNVLARVEAAVVSTGYVPHAGARSLRMGRSRLIGLVLPDITNPHFAQIARVVESACLEAGYLAAVYSTSEDDNREWQILRMMRMQRVEGLIVIPTRSDAEHGRRLRERIHVPTVLLDSYVEGLPFDVIKLDNVQAGRLGTEHLIGLGHTRIAVTTGRPNIATGEDRVRGYREAHATRDLPIDPGLLLPGRFNQGLARESTIKRMREPDAPSAILATSNMMMLGVLDALHTLGLRIPEDVSVVGIDDFAFAAIMNPPPTVMAVPVTAMAQKAITSLLACIEGGSRPTGSLTLFGPELVARASCRASPSPMT